MGRAPGAKAKIVDGGPRGHSTTAGLDLFKRGLEAARGGNHSAAAVLYRQAIAGNPNHFDAYNYLGSSLREQGDLAGAIGSYEKALELQPRSMEVRIHLAETQRRLGLLPLAIANADLAIASGHRNAEAHLVRGLARKDLGDLANALVDLRETAALQRSPTTLKLLARALMESGDKVEAAVHLRSSLQLDSKDFEAHRLCGDCLSAIGQVKEAFEAYRTSIDLNSKDPFAYANLSGMLCFTGQVDLAVAAGKIAIQLAPNMSGAHFNLGMAYETQQDYRAAVASYAEAVRCKPDLGVALLAMCRLLRHECEWEGMETAEGLAQSLTYKRGIPASPFGLLPMASTPANLLECNRLWANAMADSRNLPLTPYAPRPAGRRSDRIRIGYLSADLHLHATAALISEIFELHDKTRFQTFGYSIGNTDDSPVRRRIVTALDRFSDLNRFSHREAAERIRDDAIDILIDLKGFTSQARPQILAQRPAPIQVNYLGYPSTMGASFIDYILADAIVAPPEHECFFTEKIVRLPNSYQPNDRKRKIGAYVPSRSECGLPQHGFVFCCFNANYKLNTQMFDIWMRLLAATPGSVLWLLASNAQAPDNLRREAARRGIVPERLVFAPKLPVDDHIARLQLGDLFLDTLPIGAHTTASEALWAGLPVLTCLGEAFPGRVGASLLEAVGLAELVMPNLADYEAAALRLARTPSEIARWKAHLRAARSTAPLFDSPRYTRNYEAALIRMMEMRDLGHTPCAFTVTES